MTDKAAPPLVVHVIYEFGTGGLENGLVNIINRMSPTAYRHAIVCLTHSGVFEQRITAPNVDVYELHKKPGHDIGVFWRLWKLLRQLRPAIVHTRNLAALETQILGVLMPFTRRVHGEHGRDMNDLDGSNPKYRMLRRVMRLMVHRYIAVSQDLASYLQTQIGVPASKISQIYNGVDTDKFGASGRGNHVDDMPQRLRDRPLIGTVGRLATVKDQQTLVRAFATVLKNTNGPVPGLLLVGDGPERANLERLVDELDIAEHCWLAGDRTDVHDLLCAMSVFVLPSLAEGISNTILEAMASGLPVLATRSGGNVELVDDQETGFLFPVGDSEALAKALRVVLSQPEHSRQMGEKGAARVVRDFNWSNTVAAYQAVYDGLLVR